MPAESGWLRRLGKGRRAEEGENAEPSTTPRDTPSPPSPPPASASAKLERRILELEVALVERDRRVEQLEAELRKAQSKRKPKGQDDAQVEELARARQLVEQLREGLEQSQSRLATANQAAKTNRARCDDLRREIRSLKMGIKAERAKSEGLEKANAGLAELRKGLSVESEIASARVQELEASLATAESEMQTAVAQTREVELAAHEVADQLGRREAELLDAKAARARVLEALFGPGASELVGRLIPNS